MCSMKGFFAGSVVKNLSAMQEPRGREDPLEKEMAIHSRILAWEIPWAEEPSINPIILLINHIALVWHY